MTACKARAIPVIYLRMAWNTDARGFPIDAGLIIEQSRPFIRTEGLRRGTWGAEVLAEMPPPDYVVEKTRYSGFHNTALEALLRGLGVDTIYLAGVITNMCVEATARDAFHRDFRFVVLSDCVSGFSRKLHDASLETWDRFGRVAASGDLFAETSLQDWRKALARMLGDVDAAAEPDVLKAAHVLEQPDQPGATPGPPDQPVMQADRQQLRRTFLAFAPENVEGVAHVGDVGFSGRKPAVFIEAVVVRLVGIGNDQMRPTHRLRNQYGQFIGERIPAQKEILRPRRSAAACSVQVVQDYHPTGLVPVNRVSTSIARRICSRSTSSADLGVIDPAIAMAYDIVPALDASGGQFGVLLQRAGDPEDAHLDREVAKDVQIPARRRAGCQIRTPI